jgi:hypothetical protein
MQQDRDDSVAGGGACGGVCPGHDGALARPGPPRGRAPRPQSRAAGWPRRRSAGPIPAAPARGRPRCAPLPAIRGNDGHQKIALGRWWSVGAQGPQSSARGRASSSGSPGDRCPAQARVPRQQRGCASSRPADRRGDVAPLPLAVGLRWGGGALPDGPSGRQRAHRATREPSRSRPAGGGGQPAERLWERPLFATRSRRWERAVRRLGNVSPEAASGGCPSSVRALRTALQ